MKEKKLIIHPKAIVKDVLQFYMVSCYLSFMIMYFSNEEAISFMAIAFSKMTLLIFLIIMLLEIIYNILIPSQWFIENKISQNNSEKDILTNYGNKHHNLSEEEIISLQNFTGEEISYSMDKHKEILLHDYLSLYELNDKEIIEIYNEQTDNRLFCDRIDYLNVDCESGFMTPLAKCKISYFIAPDKLYINIPVELEKIIIKYYNRFGSKAKE